MKYIYSVTVYSCKHFAEQQHLVKNSYGWTFTTPCYIDDGGDDDDDGALLHYCTIALLHHCTIALLHYCTIALLHYCTIALLHYLHYCTIALLHLVPSPNAIAKAFNVYYNIMRVNCRKCDIGVKKSV